MSEKPNKSQLDQWMISQIKTPEDALTYLREYLTDDGEDTFEGNKFLLRKALVNIGAAYGIDLK